MEYIAWLMILPAAGVLVGAAIAYPAGYRRAEEDHSRMLDQAMNDTMSGKVFKG